ncbi:MAG: phage GP46 family protein [Thermodesulfovibrionales bacterium]|nr:phage GP46 family protein [Thermodesulfovibrionales bacterium]
MDFRIDMKDGLPEMTFEKAGNIGNNIFLSLGIQKGSFFQNPEFGSRLHELKKNTARSAALAKDYTLEALKWLKDTGRAKEIEVSVERKTDRLEMLVEVTQADGVKISYETFVEVI